MNRYFLNATPCCDSQSADMDTADNGGFYRVEDVDSVLADRDIKAANLKTLVDMVLAHADACERCERGGNDGGDVADAEDAWKALTDLARGLKQ